MDLFGKARTAELEAEIAALQERRPVPLARAEILVRHGRQQVGEARALHTETLATNLAAFRERLDGWSPCATAGWDDPRWLSWTPSAAHEEQRLRVGQLIETSSRDTVVMPGFVPFIGGQRTTIIKTAESSSARGLELLQALVWRTALLFLDRATFTLIDPSGAGQAFPMRRYLKHLRENSSDVRRDLDPVIADIQRIIERYIDATNTSFELIPPDVRVNERLHFVFVADFPRQPHYDRRAIEALQGISGNAPVAGTYLFIHYNQDHGLPRDLSMDGFRNSWLIDLTGTGPAAPPGFTLAVDGAPPAELQTALGPLIRDFTSRGQPIDWDSLVGLPEDEWWAGTTADLVATPIGRQGNGEPLRIWFGVDENRPCVHGILAAMPGAGKSNLLHVMVAGLATRYSPEELRLYLVDGKHGVEFQAYRHLPHTEVVSLRTPPQLSRSVLSDLVTEMDRRYELFERVGGIVDLPGYRERGQPAGPMPRILLVVDEYQELFEDDRDGVASAALLQLAQQARGAGIHMFLASQRFGAPQMLHQTAIFGSMHLRTAMQLAGADRQALTEFGRLGKGLIARCDMPGRIVVNDRAGDDSGNDDGRVALLVQERSRQLIASLEARAATLPAESLPRRVVFNGAAQPELLENPCLQLLLQRSSWPDAEELAEFARQPVFEGGLGLADWFTAEHPRVAWLGQEFNVRGQATLIFRRRPGENVMILGSTNTARYGMLASLLATLALNADPRATELYVLDRSIPSSGWHDMLADVCETVLQPAGFKTHFSRENGDLEMILEELTSELARRRALPERDRGAQPEVFVVFTELDQIEAVRRRAGSYGPADTPLGEQLGLLCAEGSPLGIHICLSFASVRLMVNVLDERRGLFNFRHRVALQMGEDDSFTLVRSRQATLLNNLERRPVCALYYDVETDLAVRFKPYSTEPDRETPTLTLAGQLEDMGEQLGRRVGVPV